jgi:hypothetical protein
MIAYEILLLQVTLLLIDKNPHSLQRSGGDFLPVRKISDTRNRKPGTVTNYPVSGAIRRYLPMAPTLPANRANLSRSRHPK